MNDEELWYSPIVPQRHAVERIAERTGRVTTVVGEIRLALLYGRWAATRPPSFTPPNSSGNHVPSDTDRRVYAWDESFCRCYVLKRGYHSLYLVTVLLDPESWRELAERTRLVRAGSQRA